MGFILVAASRMVTFLGKELVVLQSMDNFIFYVLSFLSRLVSEFGYSVKSINNAL